MQHALLARLWKETILDNRTALHKRVAHLSKMHKEGGANRNHDRAAMRYRAKGEHDEIAHGGDRGYDDNTA